MKSSKNKYGFHTFFKDDGLYYFQFNDKTGRPIFYSHGYQSERSRENGIQVVVRYAAEDENYERQQSKKRQHFFLLKSNNNQVIGRSITVGSKAKMEEMLNIMKDITEDTPVFGLTGAAEEQVEAAKAEASAELAEEPSTRELLIEKLPRYKFSIIYYPDSDVWTIKHDPSGNTKQFKTCDGKQIEAFLKAHLPVEKAKIEATTDPMRSQPKVPIREGIPRKQDKVVEEEIEMQLRGLQGEEVRRFAKADSLGHFEILPKKGTAASSETFDAKVSAKSLEGNKTVVVAEVKGQKPAHGRFLVPIYETNKLKPGMYRFTVSIHQGKEGEEAHDYQGSKLVMLN